MNMFAGIMLTGPMGLGKTYTIMLAMIADAVGRHFTSNRSGSAIKPV